MRIQKRFDAGVSVEGRPMEAWVFKKRGGPALLILGGMHGDEPKSVYLARRLIELLQEDRRSKSEKRKDPIQLSHFDLPSSIFDPSIAVTWVIVPVVNPDGYERRTRRNARRVDINRNFPTKNWTTLPRRSRMYGGPEPASEPETRAIISLVEKWRPACIITMHSIGGGRFCNNYDGPALKVARSMARFNGYSVTASIGYPTPGSFGTWAGRERRIPTVTLELPAHHSRKRCWQDNREAILSVAALTAASHR